MGESFELTEEDFLLIENFLSEDCFSHDDYNVPYRVDKFKSSFPEIRQVKVPIPSEMDR